MSAIQSDYRTFKHIPSRKCYQLIMEVPEEEFANVCNVLGYPRTGENTFVGIALLNHTDIHTPSTPKNTQEQTEGERLRTRAIMLCKDDDFTEFCNNLWTIPYNLREKNIEQREKIAANWIYKSCNIKSRSELATNTEAQEKFKQLLDKYKTWQIENQYKDHLDRI